MNNEEIEISIIIPVFNVEAFLPRCLDSIINQKFTNYEVLLIDDGSTDLSSQICDDYVSSDKRFKVFHIQNSGPSMARNIGLDKSCGKYIAFIDSDDWIIDGYLEKLYDLLKGNHADISVVNYIKTKNTSIDKHDLKEKSRKIIKVSNIECLELLLTKEKRYFATVWGKLYNKKLFEELRFEKGRVHEDTFILHKLIYLADIIVISNEPLYVYWKRIESITGKFDFSRQNDHVDALYDRALFFYKINLITETSKQLKILIKQVFRLIRHCDLNNNAMQKSIVIEKVQKIKKIINQNKSIKSYNQFIYLYLLFPSIINYFSYKYCKITTHILDYLKRK